MSGATATCPFCGSKQPADYIKQCGQEGKLKAQLTAVVYQEEYGKEYRPPTQAEIDAAEVPEETLSAIADEIPYGMPDEPMPKDLKHLDLVSRSTASRNGRICSQPGSCWRLMTFVKWTRLAQTEDGEVQLFIGVD